MRWRRQFFVVFVLLFACGTVAKMDCGAVIERMQRTGRYDARVVQCASHSRATPETQETRLAKHTASQSKVVDVIPSEEPTLMIPRASGGHAPRSETPVPDSRKRKQIDEPIAQVQPSTGLNLPNAVAGEAPIPWGIVVVAFVGLIQLLHTCRLRRQRLKLAESGQNLIEETTQSSEGLIQQFLRLFQRLDARETCVPPDSHVEQLLQRITPHQVRIHEVVSAARHVQQMSSQAFRNELKEHIEALLNVQPSEALQQEDENVGSPGMAFPVSSLPSDPDITTADTLWNAPQLTWLLRQFTTIQNANVNRLSSPTGLLDEPPVASAAGGGGEPGVEEAVGGVLAALWPLYTLLVDVQYVAWAVELHEIAARIRNQLITVQPNPPARFADETHARVEEWKTQVERALTAAKGLDTLTGSLHMRDLRNRCVEAARHEPASHRLQYRTPHGLAAAPTAVGALQRISDRLDEELLRLDARRAHEAGLVDILQTAALTDSAEPRILRVEDGSPTADNLIASPQDPAEMPSHSPQSPVGSISRLQLQQQLSREMPQRAGVIDAALSNMSDRQFQIISAQVNMRFHAYLAEGSREHARALQEAALLQSAEQDARRAAADARRHEESQQTNLRAAERTMQHATLTAMETMLPGQLHQLRQAREATDSNLRSQLAGRLWLDAWMSVCAALVIVFLATVIDVDMDPTRSWRAWVRIRWLPTFEAVCGPEYTLYSTTRISRASITGIASVSNWILNLVRIPVWPFQLLCRVGCASIAVVVTIATFVISTAIGLPSYGPCIVGMTVLYLYRHAVATLSTDITCLALVFAAPHVLAALHRYRLLEQWMASCHDRASRINERSFTSIRDQSNAVSAALTSAEAGPVGFESGVHSSWLRTATWAGLAAIMLVYRTMGHDDWTQLRTVLLSFVSMGGGGEQVAQVEDDDDVYI